MSHGSSSSSAPACVKAERSRALVLWWVALHGLIGASFLMLAVGPGIRWLGLVLLLAHGWWRRPASQGIVLLLGNGRWALPSSGRFRLRLGSGTAYTTLWARVVLIDAAGRREPLLLLRDQFSAEDWRKIQVALRECDNPVKQFTVQPSDAESEPAGRWPGPTAERVEKRIRRWSTKR